ncbi:MULTISPECIES: hypothetical protein [Halomonas]|nr:hypothetical protein [Halomonas sp. DN3]MBR9878678.1 hypothetical protein [Gammaproteobacteria bacterium]USZ48128.1 hypothetical protein NKF27_11365 [Halomonas sp. DN3]|tara:strand:+ start:272 stop:409 length:138 start_codon:yes stop_codon:yes gene_type:complete
MADATETQAKPAAQKTNKDGFVPGQRVSPKELAEFRNKQRKAARK